MKRVIKAIQEFGQSEEGATAVEYGVLVALIIAVCIATIAAFGSKVKTVLWDNTKNSILGALK